MDADLHDRRLHVDDGPHDPTAGLHVLEQEPRRRVGGALGRGGWHLKGGERRGDGESRDVRRRLNTRGQESTRDWKDLRRGPDTEEVADDMGYSKQHSSTYLSEIIKDRRSLVRGSCQGQSVPVISVGGSGTTQGLATIGLS